MHACQCIELQSSYNAVVDVVADAGDVVAGEVEGVLAVAEDAEEGDDDGGVQAGVAGLAQGALVPVPAPVDGDSAGHLVGGETGSELQGEEKCQEQEACRMATKLHHRAEINLMVGVFEEFKQRAIVDVVADAGNVVAGEVEGVLAVTEGDEEGDDDGGVLTCVAGLAEGALVLVAAPVDGDVCPAVGGETGCELNGDEKCQEQATGLTALKRHCGEIYG
ncbi:hypothetical protein EJB05_26935, partial [Eragrostis curvula]